MLSSLKALVPNRHPLRLAWHWLKAFLAALQYGFPARKLIVIGITGTDGKTTTVGMIAHVLQSNGKTTAALSTAFFRIGNDVQWNATQKTSPSPFAIQRFLQRAVRAGCTHAVLEYSSHGLVQRRMDWTWPLVAGITNTSPEHLDYHGTMEQYRNDKARLFRMLRSNGTKVLNAGDGTFETYQKIPSGTTIMYAGDKSGVTNHESWEHADFRLWLTDQQATARSSSAIVHLGSQQRATSPSTSLRAGNEQLTLPIPGTFNLSNALCAIGCAQAAGIPTEQCIDALKTFSGIPGRMERIDEGHPFSVYVDFTVTPASYEATLGTVRQSLSPRNRLLVLTGSCGDRMKEKRPLVGEICARLADVVVVTNEDPYTEDPEKIIDDVLAGTKNGKAEIHRIVDRKEAITFLLKTAQPGDAVLLCGKGSDTTMWVKTGKVAWDEREIARELLRKILHP